MRTRACGVGPAVLLAALLLGGCALSPVPLTPEEVGSIAADKLARVTADQEPIGGRIDLHQAMARALKYNLDHRVEIAETALRGAELEVAHWNKLPGVVAGAGWASRDNVLASSSFNLVTRTQNFGFSTSSDQRHRTADLTFSWHILDFGLSWVRARQAADKVLIAEEARRKVVHRLMEDVRTAYWRAWTAQKLVGRLRTLERRTRAALAGTYAVAESRTTSPITAMTYRRELIEIMRTLQELQRELAVAKVQLAALVNIKPGTPFTLAKPAHRVGPVMPHEPHNLVRVAIESRAEIRDIEYRRRINAHEAHAALLELLPGIQLYAGPNLDSNSFLLNEHWLSWGAKASWNLVRLFQHPARRAVIAGQDTLLDQRALALSMAIMAQVHVARVRIHHFEREVTTAETHHATQSELVRSIRAEHQADRVSEQTLLREELNAAVGELRLDIARASLESARGSLVAAVGLDPHWEGDWQALSVAELARHLAAGTSPAGRARVATAATE